MLIAGGGGRFVVPSRDVVWGLANAAGVIGGDRRRDGSGAAESAWGRRRRHETTSR